MDHNVNVPLRRSIPRVAGMHIVIIAWLYITATMALAFSNALAGIAFFVGVGLLPVMLYLWLAMRRRRAARERRDVTRAR
ncbi:MAG TPA: hypothetical protein VGI14_19645 [Casimicrobiaceae bacterium]|jgi:hypothetical protein